MTFYERVMAWKDKREEAREVRSASAAARPHRARRRTPRRLGLAPLRTRAELARFLRLSEGAAGGGGAGDRGTGGEAEGAARGGGEPVWVAPRGLLRWREVSRHATGGGAVRPRLRLCGIHLTTRGAHARPRRGGGGRWQSGGGQSVGTDEAAALSASSCRDTGEAGSGGGFLLRRARGLSVWETDRVPPPPRSVVRRLAPTGCSRLPRRAPHKGAREAARAGESGDALRRQHVAQHRDG